MSKKFQNKYRIESTRLRNWDYGWNAAYFVTICIHNRECVFGDVVNGNMVLNDLGKIANDLWLKIPEHFHFVQLGEHVVMPNHVHGIVIINKSDDGRNVPVVPAVSNVPNVETPNLGVSTINIVDPINPIDPTDDTDPTNTPNRTNAASEKWKPGTLGVIINQYKRAVTIGCRKIHADFAWQSRFHDHIIRNDLSFHRISEYIINNPLNWSEDQFFI